MICNIIITNSIKIGETALAGTILMIGINKIEIRNINPVTILVKPVLPPAVTPAAASTDATVGLVPKIPKDKTETARSEEHTSELQSRGHLVCRHLLQKKKNI